MLSISVCDDDEKTCRYLVDFIHNRLSGPDKLDVRSFGSGKQLLQAEKEPDILILDIGMKDKNGIETAREVRKKWNPQIIFVTSLKEYVFDAFDVGAFHYLLKPIQEDKLQTVLERAVSVCMQSKREEVLMIKIGTRNVCVDRSRILYAENDKRKIVLHLDGEILEYYEKMEDLEKQLGNDFFRCHRGYLVHLKYVASYDKMNIVMTNGENVYMAKQKYSGFIQAYMQYLSEKE